DQLKQLAEDKDELVGILAHDLKNYLGGINMSAGLLYRHAARFNDERILQLAENILRTSGQSLAFVKEFLANAAAEHGFVFNLAPVNLADAAAAAAQQYQEAAERKRIAIRTDFPKEPLFALADATALAHVLDNLISNALKFSPPGQEIILAVRSGRNRAECVISDQGPGFTAEDKEKMFRRYGRLSARPTDGEPSTGLGLSIVRKLVLGMGGELLCESAQGHGAKFIIRLPLPDRNGGTE
ncbi:MAG TPA: HAMP domain-containing sensor histidine kinase, partial [Verrucomicrobiae bacterium]